MGNSIHEDPKEKIGEDRKIHNYWIWEDFDKWKWVSIDMGVILDTLAPHSEHFVFDIFGSWVGYHSASP